MVPTDVGVPWASAGTMLQRGRVVGGHRSWLLLVLVDWKIVRSCGTERLVWKRVDEVEEETQGYPTTNGKYWKSGTQPNRQGGDLGYWQRTNLQGTTQMDQRNIQLPAARQEGPV